ncbi:MAG: glyoxalase/bleomycin resistance/extradiol dioxygenase family protein [Alphaproteobacteria bacterium]|nr:MAG: glyoxalase/bleomycin resistance/extradiol dioxygenase family protein [Alphaproteobacteria bacterium]
MIELIDITYARIGASDLDSSVAFAHDLVGLEIVDSDANGVYLRGDGRDHNLYLFAGDPRDHTTAFAVRSESDLRQAADALKASGFDIHIGSDRECHDRRVHAFVNFRDPSGNSIDLVARPFHSGRPCHLARGAGITAFGHVGLNSTNPKRDEKFWTEVCNARVSDWIGQAPLLRIDAVHHKIALFPTDRPGIQHINFQARTIDDIMRSWYFLTANQVRIAFGPGRHPTSGAMFLYFYGPDDVIYEYSCGVRLIEGEEGYVPRQFPAGPTSFCTWGAKPDIGAFDA